MNTLLHSQHEYCFTYHDEYHNALVTHSSKMMMFRNAQVNHDPLPCEIQQNAIIFNILRLTNIPHLSYVIDTYNNRNCVILTRSISNFNVMGCLHGTDVGIPSSRNEFLVIDRGDHDLYFVNDVRESSRGLTFITSEMNRAGFCNAIKSHFGMSDTVFNLMCVSSTSNNERYSYPRMNLNCNQSHDVIPFLMNPLSSKQIECDMAHVMLLLQSIPALEFQIQWVFVMMLLLISPSEPITHERWTCISNMVRFNHP